MANNMLPWEEAQAASSLQAPTVQLQAPTVVPQGQPDTTTKAPWEEAQELAKNAFKGIGQTVDTVVTKVKGMMPWEEAQQAAIPKAPPIMEIHRPPNKFNEVFQKLIGAESQGKHTDASGGLTTSPVGAEGITQVMPKTGVDPGYGVAPVKNKSREEYVRFGQDYLRAMLKEFNGDYEKALAAYNWGPGSVKKVVDDKGDKWKTALPAETKKYLKKILGN